MFWKDLPRAASLFRAAALHGHPGAQCNLGAMCAQARRGISAGLFPAGFCQTCHQGLGTPQDSAEAKSWYESGLQLFPRRGVSSKALKEQARAHCFHAEEKSAAQGNLDAQFNLAVLHLTGGFRHEFHAPSRHISRLLLDEDPRRTRKGPAL